MGTTQRCVCLVALATVAAAASESKPSSALVDAVDAAVQRRLADPSAKRFGITRVGDRHQPEFTPETPAEASMVSDMRRAGWNVSVYLGGRGLLIREQRPSAVQGPVVVASLLAAPGERRPVAAWLPGDGPPAYAMQYEARTAFKAVAERPTHEFSVGRWYVAARPVRASSQACVNCHNQSSQSFGLGPGTVKLGDLLGVALYAFAPAETPVVGQLRGVPAPTIRISGRVTGADEAVLSQVKFTFARLGDSDPRVEAQLIDVRPTFNADGTFTMLAPKGSFQLRVVGMLKGYYVQSVRHGAIDLLDDPMVVSDVTAAAPLLVRIAGKTP